MSESVKFLRRRININRIGVNEAIHFPERMNDYLLMSGRIKGSNTKIFICLYF
jgi:hypothetical protein